MADTEELDVRVTASGDAVAFSALTADALQADPVTNNLILSLLDERVRHPEPGRYWAVHRGDDVIGVVFQSPLTFQAAVTPMPTAAVPALVRAV
ncbi:MAG: hypothetical protein ACRDY1_15075, partial [Acidimicrobiales bacterium]